MFSSVNAFLKPSASLFTCSLPASAKSDNCSCCFSNQYFWFTNSESTLVDQDLVLTASWSMFFCPQRVTCPGTSGNLPNTLWPFENIDCPKPPRPTTPIVP